MKQCNFQNNYGTIAERFLVVHLYSTFSMDPLDFFWGGGIYTKKLLFLAILAAVRQHF